jgi:hypothetical protein
MYKLILIKQISDFSSTLKAKKRLTFVKKTSLFYKLICLNQLNTLLMANKAAFALLTPWEAFTRLMSVIDTNIFCYLLAAVTPFAISAWLFPDAATDQAMNLPLATFGY